jgi:hypothetical protein
MPNDAKLGLLAGVIGVIVAAAVSLNRPTGAAPPVETAAPNATGKPAASAGAKAGPSGDASPTKPPDPPSTPVARTKKDVDGTPACRTPMDDVEP